MIEFYKDDDAMAIRTDVATDTEFLDGCANILSEMIAHGGGSAAREADWEYVLGFWLRQIVDIACSLKGYKSDVTERTLRSAGSSHFIASTPVATKNDRQGVWIADPEKVWGENSNIDDQLDQQRLDKALAKEDAKDKKSGK